MGMQKRCNDSSQIPLRNRHNRGVNSTETPGGSGIPAGWYDDPSGEGLRWWDGEAWTEHVHTAESAAAAAGDAGGSGEEEGAPPRDLVKLRESIRGRGSKGVGMVLGGLVLVIVVVALLVSGGSESSNSSVNAPTIHSLRAANAAQAQIEKIDKQLQGKKLSKAKKKQLTAQKKQLEKSAANAFKAAKGSVKKQIEAAEAAAKEALKQNHN
jgi:Protein of unknown function (DUF2510)